MGKTIFKGELRGIVSTIGNSDAIFNLKLTEKIEGLPKDIIVIAPGASAFRDGDEVWVFGSIFQEKQKYWGKLFYIFRAEFFWNETLQYGSSM